MNSPDARYEDLETILTREHEVHEEMTRAAADLNDAIRASDLDTLRMRSAALDEKVIRMGQLEEQRIDCCAAISRALGFRSAGVKLAVLVENAPARFREKLAALHASLKKAIDNLSSITVSNHVLLEEGLGLVRARFALAAQPAGRFDRYRSGGSRVSAGLPCHSFINRTA